MFCFNSILRSSFAVKLVSSMSSFSYEEAVYKLNSLQSNKATIDQIRKDIKTGQRCTNIQDMENYLLRTGISMSKLDELSVIHVAGTKGKGSTSAMCESILRHHGYKTGFYSSPHLVAVCERIRLDGQIISREKFAKNFHEVFDKLNGSQVYEGDMPKYFAFLTVLAFNIFLKEKVDVAIIEVGIGGIVDYTNVLRKVPVVGITALGLDHTSILGNTLEEIAFAKAGIMKTGCEAYTVSQPDNAMKVLRAFSEQVKCPLHLVPEYRNYDIPKEYKIRLPVELDAYCMNASLAIQIAHAWIRISKTNSLEKPYHKIENGYSDIDTKYLISENNRVFLSELPIETVIGLSDCRWPGRYQVMHTNYAMFCLDGAHTKESMDICSKWFDNICNSSRKILIFSATGDRDVEILLSPLIDVPFTEVFFVAPTAYKDISSKNDNYSILQREEQIKKCNKNAEIWKKISKSSVNSEIYECVLDALNSVKRYKENPCVLITGSLHLVGAALSILDRNLMKD